MFLAKLSDAESLREVWGPKVLYRESWDAIVSQDYFMPVTYAQCELAVICNTGPSKSNTAESISDSLVRNMDMCSLLEINLQGSGIALHVPSLTKESILVVLLSWCPSTILPSFPSVTACLLISPPHSWGSARRLSKASCDGRYWRAILWDLKHLCNLNGLPVPFHAASNYTVTLSKTKIEKKTVKRDKD